MIISRVNAQSFLQKCQKHKHLFPSLDAHCSKDKNYKDEYNEILHGISMIFLNLQNTLKSLGLMKKAFLLHYEATRTL